VRLLQGDFDKEVVYPQKAEEMARRFEEAGAARIHVVDLDGALKGEPKNQTLIEKILRAVKVPVELGGGIRDMKQAERVLAMGVRWVIFGTKTSLDPGFLREALAALGERAIIGIDARDGQVATDGWTKVLPLKAMELAKRVESLGGKTVIYTDISRDGALQGPNLKQIDELCGALSLSVIASGGVSSLNDLKALNALKKQNLAGVVIGKALYENKFSLNEAIRACSPNG